MCSHALRFVKKSNAALMLHNADLFEIVDPLLLVTLNFGNVIVISRDYDQYKKHFLPIKACKINNIDTDSSKHI